jgi:hypothetical protein
VELTIDGMLVVADRLDLAEFTALGIRANIADEDVRARDNGAVPSQRQ